MSLYVGNRGLLIRGGDVLETASHLDTVIFDKTGTLTIGRPELQAIQVLGHPGNHQQRPKSAEGLSERRLLQLAAALEKESQHPLAQAIVAAGRAKGNSCSLCITSSSSIIS